MRYSAVLEKGKTSWGTYVPDLPGRVAVGVTRQEVINLIIEAVDMHIEDMRRRDEPIPEACFESEMIQIIAA